MIEIEHNYSKTLIFLAYQITNGHLDVVENNVSGRRASPTLGLQTTKSNYREKKKESKNEGWTERTKKDEAYFRAYLSQSTTMRCHQLQDHRFERQP
jgi:hypothetical protein